MDFWDEYFQQRGFIVPQTRYVKKCVDHPRYQVKRKPTSPCEACWRVWIERNP